jgi:single-strand DNA-binding protein
MESFQMIGRIGADASNTVLQNGTRAINFNLADSKSWTDKETGEEQTRTKWVQCTIYVKPERSVSFASFLTTGQRIYIMGTVNAAVYHDKEGRAQPVLKCNVDVFEILFDRKAPGSHEAQVV